MKRLAGILMLAVTGLVSAAEPRSAALEADIAYWTAGYQGAELGNCKAPDVPAVSRVNGEIRAVGREIAAWQRCQKTLTARLQGPVALEGRVQPEVLAAMTAAERQAAQQHVDAVHGRLLGSNGAEALAAMERHQAWLGATMDEVRAQNAGPNATRRLVAANEAMVRRLRESERLDRRAAAGIKEY